MVTPNPRKWIPFGDKILLSIRLLHPRLTPSRKNSNIGQLLRRLYVVQHRKISHGLASIRNRLAIYIHRTFLLKDRKRPSCSFLHSLTWPMYRVFVWKPHVRLSGKLRILGKDVWKKSFEVSSGKLFEGFIYLFFFLYVFFTDFYSTIKRKKLLRKTFFLSDFILIDICWNKKLFHFLLRSKEKKENYFFLKHVVFVIIGRDLFKWTSCRYATA